MAGLNDLKSRLERVKRDVRAAAKAALTAEAEAIATTMRSVVPARTGKLRGTIRVVENDDLSISVKAGGPVTTKRVRMSRRVSSTRNSPEVDYAAFVEFGTKKRPARPFFWPTWRLMKRSAKSRLERSIKKALQSTASSQGLGE